MTGEANSREGVSSAIRDWIDERINPVLLRDLRLYGRGWGMLGAYFLTLAVFVAAGVTFALAARWGGMDGGGMLRIPTALLLLVVGALVPNLAGDRFRSELSGRASELALASPLTAGRLVRGKLCGAWALSGVVLSTAAPLFATAYLLGGVTVADMAGLVGGVALAALVMPLPQLCLAARARKGGGGRILAGIAFAANILLMIGYAFFLDFTFSDEARGEAAGRLILAALAAAGILFGQFLYFVTVSRLRPDAANRELAPRLSLAFGAVAGGCAAFGIARLLSEDSYFMRRADGGDFLALAAMVVAFAFCTGMALISHGNGGVPQRAADDGRSPLSRALFSPGAESLGLYFVLCGTAILACGFAPVLLGVELSRDAEHFPPLMLCPFVAYATGLAAHSWIIRPLLAGRGGPAALSTAVLAVNVVIGLAALFAMVLVGELDREEIVKPFVYGSNCLGLFFAAFDDLDSVRRATVVGAATLALLFPAQILFALKPRRGEERGEEHREKREGDPGNAA